MEPTVSGFIWFIQSIMGISSSVLPTTAPVIQWSFDLAVSIANQQLQAIPIGSPPYSSIYNAAVYNLAGDFLIQYAPDVPDAPIVPGSNPPAPFFQNQRQSLGINTFVGGVIQSTGDQGTNQSMVVPDFAQGLTMMNLSQVKTVWGRTYLSLAQGAGTMWGIS